MLTCQLLGIKDSDGSSLTQVVDSLGLSYKNSRELNAIVDTLPTSRPPFKCEEFDVAGLKLDLYYRDVIQCIQALFGDPELACYLVFLPEHHYLDADHTIRLYYEIHTGK